MAHSLTIHQLVERLRAGELSSREATQACLNRVEQVDGRLNAFISVDANDALAQADAADQSRTAGEDLPCLLYTSPSPRDGLLSRMPSSA